LQGRIAHAEGQRAPLIGVYRANIFDDEGQRTTSKVHRMLKFKPKWSGLRQERYDLLTHKKRRLWID